MELNEETIKNLRLTCTHKGNRYVEGYKQVPVRIQLGFIAGVVVALLIFWTAKL